MAAKAKAPGKPPSANRTAKSRASKDPLKSKPGAPKKWSAQVAKTSDALDLQPGIFKLRSAHAIALALKNSAEASRRRKTTPFRSAMSMLNFEVNRGGKGLSPSRRETLEKAKVELRKVFHRPPA